MPTVSGIIRTETGGPALNATVQAFDKDLRHEQLLGAVVITETSGRYEITYTAERFRRAEKKSADLIVRAFDRAGNLRAESETRFNAADNERIDLTFGPLPVVETPRLSELESLQQSIEPVREGVAYRDFTDQDLNFLTEETIRAGSLGVSERRTVRQRLGFLSLADRFALQTAIPLAAFYGWFRQDQPQVLGALLDVPIRTLRAALVAAIGANIIPDITAQLTEILERVGGLRFEHGRLVNHRFVVQLINAQTNRPLAGYSVAVSDPAAEPDEQQLGTLVTDGRGALVIVFALPGEAAANATRRLQLGISDDGVEVAEATIDARANQEEVATLRVRLRESDSGDVAIEESAPTALAARLRQRGIRTLRDVLNHPEVVDEDDAEALEQLRARAKFAILAPELGSAGQDHLLNRGYRSLLDVGATSRAEFVRDDGVGGDAVAYATHVAARETDKVLYHMIGSAWIKNVTSPGDQPDDPDIPTGVNDVLSGLAKCGCKDCDSAVSPTAYLAHLLQWTLEHIKDGTASISFSQMEEEFHQPFGDLPASCAAVEDQLRQVRICVETLWRFTGFLDRPDLQLPTPFRTAYRELRNQLYRAILAHLGTSFEQLRKATLQVAGDDLTAEIAGAQRRAIADVLGIDESHLNALFFNVEQPPVSPSEDELHERFGFRSTRVENVFASTGTPDLAIWQRERLESIWQEEDWPTDAYSGEARLPFVDPALIDESYLRTPLEENAAATLLEARRAALATHRQTLVDQAPQQNGLAQLLESELGQSVDELRSLYATLQTGSAADEIVGAHATIGSLHLTPAGFTHLMGIDAHFAADEPLGATPEEVEAAWAAVFDVLSRAHRRGLFPAWVEEENNIELIFGPRLFWLPLEASASASAWLATPSELVEWQDALGRRSARPVIDPDQIPSSYVILFAVFAGAGNQGGELGLVAAQPQPPLTAMTLWQQRRAWIDGRLEAVSAARQNQPNGLARLEAALSASTVGVGLDAFAELASMDAEGRDLGPRLAQLNFTVAQYRFLAEIRQLAQGNATISSDLWQQVDANLVQIEKHREFAQWRLAEQAAEITLHPHRFVVPKDPKSIDDSPQLKWLYDPIPLQQWVDTLEARADHLRALREGLDAAVSNAEEGVLPLLRNILIMQTVAEGDSLLEKSEWLDKRLLIDMRIDGCQMTTRVSQAIETLQRFIRGVYTHEHPPLMQHLTLDAEEDYEAEWPVIGSYATWRAFMLAYLFPENLLHLSPPLKQSYGFEQLKKRLAAGPAREDVCAEARAYGEYFGDVCSLTVQASCQIRTFVGERESCEPTTATTPSTLHLFARAQTSGKVYWATLNPAKESTDTTTSWIPLPKLGVIEQIFGATPHFTPNGRRFVLLFFAVRTLGKMQLRFASYDVDGLQWSDDAGLALPSGGEDGFSAAVIQKRGANPDFQSGDLGFPTLLAVKPEDGPIYINELNQEAVGWKSAWNPLFGPGMLDSFKRVLALIARTSNEYVILAERTGPETGIGYRFLYLSGVGRDDLTWKQIGFGEGYNGGITWFSDTSTFLFYTDAGGTVYQRLGAAGSIKPVAQSSFRYHHSIHVDQALGVDDRFRDVARQIADDIVRFNDEWLEPYVGVSLRDYRIANFRPNFFVPHEDEEGLIDPLNPDRENIQEIGNKEDFLFFPSSLTLLDVFGYELKGTDITIPEGARFRYHSLDLEFYQIQLQYQYVQEFLKHIAAIDSAKILEGDLGRWKFADQQIKRFSDGGLSLADLIARFVANVTEVYLPEYAGGIYSTAITSFRERDKSDELGGSHPASSDQWMFVSTSGDERAGAVPRRAVVIQKRNGPCWWTRLRRNGDVLTGQKLLQLAPRGAGPFDLLPERDINALKQRRVHIETMWQPHRNAPASVRGYLKEAYNLVPLYVGYELQRGGNYEEALLWYRQVYDYVQPPGAQRKIDYSLRLEEELGYGYEDAEEWLDDASNPHAIAATRKNTYTRHVLLMIVRCLIDYANALFSRDNVTDNARARELYTLALTLLELGLLKPGSSPCANIIGQLEIDVVEPGTFPLQQFKLALATIPDPDRLSAAVTALRATNQDTSRSPIDRLADMREIVVTAVDDIPAAARMTDVLQTKRQTTATLENRFLADPSSRMLLTKTQQRARQATLTSLAEVTDRSEEALLEATTQLPWLRLARPEETDDAADERPTLALFNASEAGRLAVTNHIKSELPMASLAATHGSSFAISTGISFDFCIPQNPVIQALRTRAQNNLVKLRTCRNIAGFLRDLDPYGGPIGIGSGMVSLDGSIFSGIVDAPPTAYRYAALIGRAKELVGISQQIEAGYQAALENAEREALNLMQAQQSVELAGARVSLQDLRVTQANGELGLAQLQKSSAVLREDTYAGWIAAGPSEFEDRMLQAHKDAGAAQESAAIAGATAQAANAAMALIPEAPLKGAGQFITGVYAAKAVLGATAVAASIAEGVYNVKAIQAQTSAEVNSTLASFERRNDEWQLQEGLAALDVQMGDQQIVLAGNQIAIAEQELAIAGLEQGHAIDILNFLLGKTFTEEMYRWIASVLEDVYRYFLQEATAISRLAQQQLAFERQQQAPKLIQTDYWSVMSTSGLAGDNADRLGLTGSARLLKDIYQLDSYAFETRQRKQALTITLDLAAMFPIEFQRFRETGVLVFNTPQSLIDRQMPGYYLCLIQQVSVSVVALIPPTYGIRSTLTSAGLSRVVVGGDTFQTVTIRNLPERLALTSAITTSGAVTLEPDSQSLLNPFEGSGFDTLWELRMPKAANPFDYNSMATVLFTVNLTALHSFDYEREVIARLDRKVSFDRAFDFRQVFPDPWYDLNNPDQTPAPMAVRFSTRRSDFPPNLTNLDIQHVVLYLVRKDGEVFEQPIRHLHFTADGTNGPVGGPASTVNGRVSTRSGNGTNWLPFIGQPPIGEWELAFPDDPPSDTEARTRFTSELIENILLVISLSGQTPAFPY